MGIADWFNRFRRDLNQPHADGESELKVGDPMYDNWDIVQDFQDFEAGRAWKQLLLERGMNSVLTSDWPLDRYGRGDISLRVEPGLGLEAEELLSGDDD